MKNQRVHFIVCLFITYYWEIVSYSHLGFQCRDPMNNLFERPSNQENLMLIYLVTIYWSHVGFLIGIGKDLFVPKFVKYLKLRISECFAYISFLKQNRYSRSISNDFTCQTDLVVCTKITFSMGSIIFHVGVNL